MCPFYMHNKEIFLSRDTIYLESIFPYPLVHLMVQQPNTINVENECIFRGFHNTTTSS